MKVLLIVLLIAVIGLVVWQSSRARAGQADALPRDDRPDELAPASAPEEAAVDLSFDREPAVEPAPSVQTEPPAEPPPVAEPEDDPVAEPEPGPEPEAEPVVEPDTAGVEPSPEEDPATDPDEPTDPPRAVIEAGEVGARELDPDAGWGHDEDTTIHADPQSGLYHTPDSPGYLLGEDGQVFESEEEAKAAGFTRWDDPR